MMFSVARQRSKSRHSQAFPGSLRAAFLIAAAGLTAVFPPASGACAQTDQAAHAQAAQTPSGQIPQHDMNSSMPASASETTVPSDGAAKPSAPASEPGHAAPASLPHNLSPWGMFLAADIIVKIVMTGLACASFVTWTVALAKGIELLLAKRALRIGLAKLAAAQTLSAAAGTLTDQHGRIAQFVAAAFAEAERSTGLPADGTKERAAALLTRLEQRAGRAMTRGTGALATIGATAPFVGLFGTVWGIMNSFIGISKANTTNLAVVAPGIAEALLATALGLVAAIPAVVIYNLFARSITSYKALLADASTEVMRHLSRDLDRQLFVPEHDARVVMMRRGAE